VAWLPPTGRMGLAHASYHALTAGQANGRSAGWGKLPYPQYVTVKKMICRPLNGNHYSQPLLVEADGEVLGSQYTAISVAEKKLHLLWPRGAH
jgi:diacylglycerol kinase (ATP)